VPSTRENVVPSGAEVGAEGLDSNPLTARKRWAALTAELGKQQVRALVAELRAV
jgi:hypothetical protein